MSVNQEILEQIDQYLEGTLSGSSLTTFEERLATDASLQQLVEEQQLIIRAIHKKELSAVKKKLFSYHEELVEDLKEEEAATNIRTLPKQRYIGRWLAVAASVLLLVGSYFVFIDNPIVPNTEIVQEGQMEEEEELRLATSRGYEKIPVQNKAGARQKDIYLLITPTEEPTLKYTLNEEVVVLFMEEERKPLLEHRLFYKEDLPGVYFVKLADDYYQLIKTDTRTIAEIAPF